MGGVNKKDRRSLSRAAEFREVFFSRKAMVADGAMGTMLYDAGVFLDKCFDELNLSRPGLIKEIHQSYVEVGAEILETNTFGANRVKLNRAGLGDRLEEINAAGVRLAREAAGGRAFVAGSMGPLGVNIEPLGPTSFAEARALFREQAEALLDAGIDLLILETFSNIDELREALAGARAAAGTDMVIVALVTTDDEGRMLGGGDAASFAPVLEESPADIIGCNHSSGPRVMLDSIEEMIPHISKPLCAMPNAGPPERVEGRSIFLCSPEYMTQYARRFIQAGVRLLGGCCGTRPEHIKPLRNEVISMEPRMKTVSLSIGEGKSPSKASPRVMKPVPLAEKSRLGAALAAGRFVSFVEILPPRGVDSSKEIEGARLCRAHGIDCINVPDGPRAMARMSAMATCRRIQEEVGIEAVLHFCCRDRNILGIQSELMGAQALGIRNLICISGDPPRMGTYPDATAVFDVDSIGLVNIVNQLNHGLDIGRNPIGSQTSLVIGVGANPGAVNLDEELRRFEWKVEAGAEFAVTQPVFDIDLLERFIDKTARFKIPIIAGIWPLLSLRNAEFMINELRVPVPEHFLARMRGADTQEKARAIGVEIAQDMITQVQDMVQGVGLSAPFGRYHMAIEAARAIRAPSSSP